MRGWAKRRSQVSRHDLLAVSCGSSTHELGRDGSVAWLIDLLVPGIEIAMRQDYFCFWVRGDELFGEENRRHVRNTLAVSEQLVELGTAIRFSLAIILGLKGLHPHLIVARVFEKRLPAMVALVDAEQTKGSACC